MKKYIFNLYSPIFEKEDQEKYISLKNERMEQINFYRKVCKKEIRKLLDKTIKGHWQKHTTREDYKNLGSLAEWLILDYYTRRNSEETNNNLSMLDYLRKENLELKKEIKLLKK